MKNDSLFCSRMISTRKKLKLSQEQLAKNAKMAPAAISHFETGARKPSFDNLRRLADVLSVTADYLLGRTADPHGFVEADAALRHGINALSQEQKDFAMEVIQSLGKKNLASSS